MIPEARGYPTPAGVVRGAVRRAGALIGGVGTLLRLWPMWRPFGRVDDRALADYVNSVPMGTCALCNGTVLYSRRARIASCPCGSVLITASFMRARGMDVPPS